MKVHLKQVPADGLHLEGEEDCPITEFEAEEIRGVGPLSYNIDIGVAGGALWATGSLRQKAELRCVACLEKFVYELSVPAFAMRTELHGPETVDLTPFMREDLLLNLPAHPRCDRDGGRVCKAAQSQPATQNAKGRLDWSELDKLRLK
ncbi:MAG TPA: hypothetical protein VFO30_02935 [Chthoniobacterales bacterium]|nr:hypothetical protein [Chthoniobacterales bacterium]